MENEMTGFSIPPDDTTRHVVSVDFVIEADDEESAVNLVQFELAAMQEYKIDSALNNYMVRKVY